MTRAPQLRYLADGKRLHLQDGPIDLIVEANGTEASVGVAYSAAARRFTGLLDELCDELPLLRKAADPARCLLRGKVARRMHDAVAPFAANCFITPMAAVAGSVAEEILAAMLQNAQLARAYVNNGGDIALHLNDAEHFTLGLADRPDAPGLLDCNQRPSRTQFLARHCRCRHRSGADRIAGRRRSHHRCERSRFGRASCHCALPGA